MNPITIDDVKHLATLSALSISDKEAESMTTQLQQIIGYFNQLNEIDTTGIEPTYQVTGLENVMRNDEIQAQLPQKELLKNAHAVHEDGHIKVGRVL